MIRTLRTLLVGCLAVLVLGMVITGIHDANTTPEERAQHKRDRVAFDYHMCLRQAGISPNPRFQWDNGTHMQFVTTAAYVQCMATLGYGVGTDMPMPSLPSASHAVN